jgi:hypothetical protein
MMTPLFVIPGLVPGIYPSGLSNGWMRGIKPRMTLVCAHDGER